MAITLPDFTALPQAVPQAGGNLPQYPANDPGAAALETLGKGISAAGGAAVDYAAYKDILQTKMDRATADADFTNATIPLTEQLKVETDPDKITALKGQFQAALESAAGNFTNPLARDYWMKGHSHVVATGQAEADLRNSAVYRDNYQAGLTRKFDEIGRTGAVAEDPLAFGASLVNIDQMTDAAKLAGTPATRAEEMRSKARADMVLGRIDTLITRNKNDEARAVLDTYGGDLNEVARARAEAAIQGHGAAVRTYGSAQRALGIGGAPAAPGAGAGAPGTTTPAEHYNYLTSIGATPNQAALLTSAAGAELGFDPTKTHDGGIGYGLYGHNGDRLAAMQQQFGQTPSWQQQAQFALNELQSRPEGAAVNAAKTPEELTDLQFQFEQPKRGPGDQSAERLASTREYMTNPPKAPAGAPAGGAAGVIANPPRGGPDVIERALKMSGQQENSADLAKYLHDGGVDMDPKKLAWCAGFVNATLAQTGQRGTDSPVATSFLKWGNPVANPDDVKRGDVAVVAGGLPAGALGGHVGFATGNKRVDPDTGKPQIEVLGGNERVDPNDPKAGHLVDTRWRDADTLTLRRARGAGAGAASAFQQGAQAASAAPGTPARTPPTGAAVAPATPAAAVPGAGGQIDSAGGDSIAAQQANSPGVAVTVDKGKANGPIGPGTARVGDNPESVRKRLEGLPTGALKGNFMLSTGASNTIDPQTKVADLKQFDAIPAQIAASKKAGAERVIIPGVGPGVANQAEANAKLKQLAEQNGATFVMPDIGWQIDGIHPANHREMRAKVGAALAGAAPAPAAPTPAAPPPKGLVEPGNIPLNLPG